MWDTYNVNISTYLKQNELESTYKYLDSLVHSDWDDEASLAIAGMTRMVRPIDTYRLRAYSSRTGKGSQNTNTPKTLDILLMSLLWEIQQPRPGPAKPALSEANMTEMDTRGRPQHNKP
jgi:hypothetical protein